MSAERTFYCVHTVHAVLKKKIFEIHVLRTLYIKYNALHYICLKEIT